MWIIWEYGTTGFSKLDGAVRSIILHYFQLNQGSDFSSCVQDIILLSVKYTTCATRNLHTYTQTDARTHTRKRAHKPQKVNLASQKDIFQNYPCRIR